MFTLTDPLLAEDLRLVLWGLSEGEDIVIGDSTLGMSPVERKQPFICIPHKGGLEIVKMILPLLHTIAAKFVAETIPVGEAPPEVSQAFMEAIRLHDKPPDETKIEAISNEDFVDCIKDARAVILTKDIPGYARFILRQSSSYLLP